MLRERWLHHPGPQPGDSGRLAWQSSPGPRTLAAETGRSTGRCRRPRELGSAGEGVCRKGFVLERLEGCP